MSNKKLSIGVAIGLGLGLVGGRFSVKDDPDVKLPPPKAMYKKRDGGLQGHLIKLGDYLCEADRLKAGASFDEACE